MYSRSNPIGRRLGAVTMAALLAVAALASGLGPVALAGAASCTPVTGPTTVTSPGCYELTSDVVDSGATTYVDVRSSDVVLEGNGHALDGVGTFGTVGVRVGAVDNVTVRNLTATDWGTGVELDGATDAQVVAVAADENEAGVVVSGGSAVTVARSSAADNAGVGVQVLGGTTDLVVESVRADRNGDVGVVIGTSTAATARNLTLASNGDSSVGYGLIVSGAPDAVVTGVSATGHPVGVLVEGASANATVRDLRVVNATIGVSVLTSNVTVADGLVERANAVGVDVDTTGRVLVENVTVTAGVGDGFAVHAADVELRNNTAVRRDRGFAVDIAPSVALVGNNATLNDRGGIYVRYGLSTHLAANVVAYNGQQGIVVDSAVDGATLVDNVATTNGDTGIVVRNSADAVVRRNVLDGNRNAGIRAFNSPGVAVVGNDVRNSAGTQVFDPSGIRVRLSDNATVADNVVSSNDGGIFVGLGSANVTVAGNDVHDNDQLGIEVGGPTGAIVDNRIVGNDGGGVLVTPGINPFDGRTAWYLANNTVANHSVVGITVAGLANVTVADTAVTDSGVGLSFDRVTGGEVTRTVLTDNDVGLRFVAVAQTVVSETNASGNADTAVRLANTTDVTLTAVSAGDSGQWALDAHGDHPGTTLAGFDLGDSTLPTTVGLDSFRNVALAAVAVPPAPPAGSVGVGHYVRVANTSVGTTVAPGADPTVTGLLTVGYDAGALGSVDETTLSLSRYDGAWTALPGVTVDPTTDSVSGSVADGGVVGVLAPAGNDPPSAALTATPAGPDEGSPVTFDASASTDTDGAITAYEWDFGDGNVTTTASPVIDHAYADDGAYTVTLTVTDDDDASTATSLPVSVSNVAPTVDASVVGARSGSPIWVNATVTDPGTADTHTATVDWGDGTVEPVAVTQGTGTASLNASHVYATGGSYTVTLTVTDDDGGVTTVTRSVAVAYAVDIDVKPGNGDAVDPVNPKANGPIPVVVSTTDAFDATTVNVSSLRLGTDDVTDAGDGATPAHGGHLEDVDGDGDLDLVVHFAGATGLEAGDDTVTLVGETTSGVALSGSDAVRVAGGGNGNGNGGNTGTGNGGNTGNGR